MSWIFTFVGFAALIILHEFGHFAAAKAVGMRVERFSLFFGKPIFSHTRGETEYRIGVIPLGGYVKITGMSPYEELEPDVAHRAYLRQPVWKRIVVIAAGPFVNVVIFLVLVFAVLLHQGQEHDALKVGGVLKRSAAAHTFKLGDRILSIDGIRAYAPNLSESAFVVRQKRVSAAIQRHICAPPRHVGCVATTAATVVVERANVPGADGIRRDARLTLHIRPQFDASQKPARMLLGITWGTEFDPISVGTAASSSFTAGWNVTKETVSRVTSLFTSAKARKQISSAVGAYEVAREEFADNGLSQALQVLALISLSLAIINLFPFLPLDGGHIAWALVEKIRGKAVPFRVIERASVVGFVLIMGVFLIGLSNDIGHLSGSGFGVRR